MAETWKPTGSFAANAMHDVNPFNYSFLDWLGFATGSFAGGLGKLVATEAKIPPSSISAAINAQLLA